jgi:hypothetical protein
LPNKPSRLSPQALEQCYCISRYIGRMNTIHNFGLSLCRTQPGCTTTHPRQTILLQSRSSPDR